MTELEDLRRRIAELEAFQKDQLVLNRAQTAINESVYSMMTIIEQNLSDGGNDSAGSDIGKD